MGTESRNDNRTVSAKLPAALLAKLDRMAEYRCVSRSFLIRELAEAAIEGRVIFRPAARRRGMTLAELAASDVGAAVQKRAQLEAAAACRDAAAAQDVDISAHDVDAVARRAARLVAEGR